ncbi:MAG: M16 family metallopeptidase, partial [Candidatus Eiseniibacteriota bacterium]
MTPQRHRVVLVMALAVIAATALAGPAPAQPRETSASASRSSAVSRSSRAQGADIQTKTLANGLKIIVWPDHDIPNLALYTFYRVGSRNERTNTTGLSHFFEHMMFKGSAHFKEGEFDRVMESNGGANNAYTTQDVTVYSDWFARGALPLVLQLEADRICCLSFDSTAVENERGVVYSERRTSVDDNGRDFLDEQVMAAAFVAHPYHIPIIGWPSDIERWTIPDLKEYFRTYYAPNNATMLLVGDIEPADAFAQIERALGSIPSQPPPPPVRTAEPVQPGERRVTVRRPAQVPLLEASFHATAANAPDAEALDLLEAILTSGESSRLYRRLVDQDQVAIDVDSWLQRGFDPGIFSFFVTVSPGKGVAAAESSLVDELARVAKSGVTDAELKKAKTIRLAAYWRSLKTIDGKAEALGNYQVFRGDYRRLFDAPDRYAKVTRAEVQATA